MLEPSYYVQMKNPIAFGKTEELQIWIWLIKCWYIFNHFTHESVIENFMKIPIFRVIF